MENNGFTEPLNLEFYFSLLIFPLKVKGPRNALKLQKNVKKLNFGGDWAKL